MKNFCSITLLALLVFSLLATDANAQRFNRRKIYSSVTVQLNAMNYFGDVVPEDDFTSLRLKSTRPNIGVFYTRRFTPRISVRGGLSWGRITGDDAKSVSVDEKENLDRLARNLSFRNDIKELSVVATFDLFENRGTYLKRPDFSPYGFVGVAVFAHNPKTEYNGEFVALQPLGTEGQYAKTNQEQYPDPYSLIQISIPFGLGVKYKLDRNWDLGFEIGWRKTFTDYLDDVSGTYANKADLQDPIAIALSDRSAESPVASIKGVQSDPELGASYPHIKGYGTKGQIRGDRTDKDWYIVTGFNLSYILPTQRRSPKFR